MADTKITALAALTGANLAAGDLFPFVDVSDTSMAGSGTDKSITRDQLKVGLLDGWIPDPNTWVFGSATSFGVAGDATGYLRKGTKVSYNDGAVDYGVIAAVSFLPAASVTGVASTVATSLFTKIAHGLTNGMAVVASGFVNTTGIANGALVYVIGVTANTFQLATTVGGAAITLGGTADTNVTITGATLVTLITTSDYSIANATLTAPRYSYDVNPQGFPTWFNWTPTLAGWSVEPGTCVYRYSCVGTAITVALFQLTDGTSNNTIHTITLPVVAATITGMAWGNTCRANDNGTFQAGSLGVASGATTMRLNGILATNLSTASGASRVGAAQCVYEF